MGSSFLGSLIGLGLGAAGDKPKVPELATINPDAVQSQAIQGNIANFGDIAKLATSVNTLNQDQLNALMDKTLGPGTREQFAKNIASQARGELPEDVKRQIVNYGAARGNALTRGSGFGFNATAKDIGTTSLQLMNNALSSAESWLKSAQAPMFDASSMFFTPTQRLAFEQQQQSMKFQRDSMAAGVEAAPDPGMAYLSQGIDSLFGKAENAGFTMGGMWASNRLFGGGGNASWPGGGSGLSSTAPQGWYGLSNQQRNSYLNQVQNAQTFGTGTKWE